MLILRILLLFLLVELIVVMKTKRSSLSRNYRWLLTAAIAGLIIVELAASPFAMAFFHGLLDGITQ